MNNLLSESGIIITLLLLAIPIIIASLYLIVYAKKVINDSQYKNLLKKFNEDIGSLSSEEILKLKERANQMAFHLTDSELGSNMTVNDPKGLVPSIDNRHTIRFVDTKKKTQAKHNLAPPHVKLIISYIVSATFWLVFGTTIGEYLGIKFSMPDIDHYSWLSFGRLRPVHTNVVFWGWCSLAMIGLGYYVIPKTNNVVDLNIKKGYWSLYLINISIIVGTLCLMAGINNSGGEYREYIWPVMAVFGIGVLITLQNFYTIVSKRQTTEIYISSWYIISALIFLLVITLVAYIPLWQNGLGETIAQGYYMHQGVGMWFMLFCLGLMYYFLPQQLNKPIYSYSLGIIAFWSQILFYTLIGTHHFIFSSIPWWLQTVAIVGSAGMVIPVVAGTTNFFLTFRGSWHKVAHSYSLPFYVIGIVFYFTGSLQGTAEAFRFTNQLWHFTDFTVAHSHITMYGIITFMLWAFIYTILPRLTGNEAPQVTIGAHFWLAFIGLLFYTFPLMYGSTLRGLMWMDSKPFIESVTLMKPYWLWRAIGGSFMWLSHLIFAYNIFRILKPVTKIAMPTTPMEVLEAIQNLHTNTKN